MLYRSIFIKVVTVLLNKKTHWQRFMAIILVLSGFCESPSLFAETAKPASESAPSSTGESLTVTLVKPSSQSWPNKISASGMVMPWQDALVAAETGGLRVTMVGAEVGDVVKKGQVLATLAAESVEVDIAQQEARLAQAEAKLAEARTNANRSRSMQHAGALSTQQIDEYLMSEKAAEANVAVERAALESQRLRLRQTRVLAPDDGIITLRSAMLGQVAQVGTELFRMIRQSRLIWLAQISVDKVIAIQIGQTATITLPGGIVVGGTVRRISPVLDGNSLNALVSVSMEPNPLVKSGMFAHGDILLGDQTALSVPQTAISWRDGKSYLFTLDADRSDGVRVLQRQVQLGRRVGQQVEVLSGLRPEESVVETGAAFLGDGDRVRLISDDSAAVAKHQGS